MEVIFNSEKILKGKCLYPNCDEDNQKTVGYEISSLCDIHNDKIEKDYLIDDTELIVDKSIELLENANDNDNKLKEGLEFIYTKFREDDKDLVPSLPFPPNINSNFIEILKELSYVFKFTYRIKLSITFFFNLTIENSFFCNFYFFELLRKGSRQNCLYYTSL